MIDREHARQLSLAERCSMLPAEERRRFLETLPEDTQRELPYAAEFWGRPEQQWRPGLEAVTLYSCGRAWGKGFTGSHATIYVARRPWLAGGRKPRGPEDRDYGKGAILGIAGRTISELYRTQIHGPSGIMAWSPPHFRPELNKADKTLTWPNGAIAHLFSGDVPESFRGPNIGFLWGDEIAYWARALEAWRAARMMLRHGPAPRAVLTTTPLGIGVIIDLVYDCDESGTPKPPSSMHPSDVHGRLNPRTRVVHGSTFDNAANLPADYLDQTVATVTGRLREQEVEGRLLFGARGALWRYDWIKRADEIPPNVEIVQIVVAVDPASGVLEGETPADTAEIGIVVMAIDSRGDLWLLEDWSGTHSPNAWGDLVVQAMAIYGARVVGEENYGGNLIRANVQAALDRWNATQPRTKRLVLRYDGVSATRNKLDRAGLVNGLWEAGRVTHVEDRRKLPEHAPRRWVRLEYQLTHYVGKGASDRMDAAVWGALALAGDGTDRRAVEGMRRVDAWAEAAKRVRSRYGIGPR